MMKVEVDALENLSNYRAAKIDTDKGFMGQGADGEEMKSMKDNKTGRAREAELSDIVDDMRHYLINMASGVRIMQWKQDLD
ncbi:hypothetical protein Tco_0566650 [Tanacetum coccineum]